ncbi:hypothetical protein BDR04DRAFT_1100500 [Suillus decipiens]|nr:hypothetical protein BDR04DRAFT_1100500 [Suillus decipiens]
MGRVMGELRTSTGNPVTEKARKHDLLKLISYSIIYVIANAMAILSILATSGPLKK